MMYTVVRIGLQIILFLSLLIWPIGVFATHMRVVALFKDWVVIVADGNQEVLKVGDSTHEGMKLLSANSEYATFEFKGKQYQYGISRQINSTFTANNPTARILLNEQGQYITQAKFNGSVGIDVLIDTGANLVTLSSEQARALNIDYSNGNASTVETASGSTNGYQITLDSMAVSGLKIYNVDAVIIEGAWPVMPLLGMSYLKSLDMLYEDGMLVLSY